MTREQSKLLFKFEMWGLLLPGSMLYLVFLAVISLIALTTIGGPQGAASVALLGLAPAAVLAAIWTLSLHFVRGRTIAFSSHRVAWSIAGIGALAFCALLGYYVSLGLGLGGVVFSHIGIGLLPLVPVLHLAAEALLRKKEAIA